jgi:hypothetical protein
MHPSWGTALVKLIATKFGNSLNLTNFVIRSNFGIDWYSKLGSGEVQSLLFLLMNNKSSMPHAALSSLAGDAL